VCFRLGDNVPGSSTSSGYGLRGLWLGLVISNVFRSCCLGWIVFHSQDWEAMARRAQRKAEEKAGDADERVPLAQAKDIYSDDEED
jgi:hypothetical protein